MLAINARNVDIMKVFCSFSGNFTAKNLKISVPKNVNLEIEIIEFGEVDFKLNDNECSISIYEGRVSGSTNSLISTTIVREGDINLQLNSFYKANYLILSSYRGNINLNLPEKFDAKFDLETATGNFINESKFKFKEEGGDNFTEKIRGISKESKSLVLKNSSISNKKILIKTIHGNIKIKQ